MPTAYLAKPPAAATPASSSPTPAPAAPGPADLRFRYQTTQRQARLRSTIRAAEL